MDSKIPFNKNKQTKILFSDIVELIHQDCDYHFAIIDKEVDDELIALAKAQGIDLTGYKHVIETSGTRQVGISNHLTKKHGLKTIVYKKIIGNQYVYVEEIRIGRNKSLAFVSLYKRPVKKASHK